MKGRITPEVIAAAKEKKTAKVVKREAKTSKIAPAISDEQYIDALKKVGHPAVSSEVAKLLHTTNGAVRTRMEKLIAVGKVKGNKPEKDKHVKLLYSVA